MNYDLDNIKMDFNEKVFLILLRRSFGKQHEGQRKMLLLAYFDDIDSTTASQSASNPSPLQPTENTTESSNKGKSVDCQSFPLSPLKRQMSQISINPESSPKKKLSLDDNQSREESSSSGK
ncbi:hypothetical protein Leryth_014307 [Lithospermum erythrorhizon]|nr:hypothetical protein Leryth_014307 [Lithospermum erythrorhizon]